jgi:Putative prokaryotic signal transducing protein
MENDKQIKAVYQAMNKFEAETIRLLLESFEIPVEMIGESAGTAYGLGGGPLGEVSIYVPTDRAEEAVTLIERMQKGDFELPPDQS